MVVVVKVIIVVVLIIGGIGGCGKAGGVVAVFLFFLPARVVILMAIGNRSVGSAWSLRGLSCGPRGRHGRSGHSGRSRRKGNHGRHRNTNTNASIDNKCSSDGKEPANSPRRKSICSRTVNTTTGNR